VENCVLKRQKIQEKEDQLFFKKNNLFTFLAIIFL